MERLFRQLRADEIDCRIGTIKENGLSLLLYKDARCDMNILDETFGAFGWQRTHSRDNANCTVSVYDSEKNQWISKEDTGTESNTEAEKGLASDSFKRACFNWGIGRELYTAPFIWISAENCQIRKIGERKFTCNDKFRVSEIEYDERNNISRLVISNATKGVDVFVFPRFSEQGKYTAKPKETQQKPAETTVQATEAPDGYFYCEDCGSVISGIKQSGLSRTPREVAERALKKHGRQLCWSCQKTHEKQTA